LLRQKLATRESGAKTAYIPLRFRGEYGPKCLKNRTFPGIQTSSVVLSAIVNNKSLDGVGITWHEDIP